MTIGSDPHHISAIEDARGGFTPAQLVRLSDLWKDARETADCGMDLGRACERPRPSEECVWGPTVFCARRMIVAGVESSRMDAAEAANARRERAEACSIPRWAYQLVGVSTGKASLAPTPAVDHLRFLVRPADRDKTGLLVQRVPFAVLSGPDGAGKRTAAAYWCWLMGGWYYQATKIQWWTPRGGFRPDPEDYRLLTSPAVAIVALDKPWAGKEGIHRRNLVHVLHERLDADRTTLLTTNLGRTDLEGLLGGSLLRKLDRDGSFLTVTSTADEADGRLNI